MEIVAVLLLIGSAIFAITKVAHSHRKLKEEINFEIKKRRAKLLDLVSKIENLHEQLEAKFTDEYMESLHERLDEDEYETLKRRLMVINKATGSTFTNFTRELYSVNIEDHLGIDKAMKSIIEGEECLYQLIESAGRIFFPESERDPKMNCGTERHSSRSVGI